MFDPATVSKLADETGLPLDETRAICAQIECKQGVTSPFALARTWCLSRKRALAAAAEAAATVAAKAAQAAASPRPPLRLVTSAAADSASQPQSHTGYGDGYADPEVAADALATIRAILDQAPQWQPSPRKEPVSHAELLESFRASGLRR